MLSDLHSNTDQWALHFAKTSAAVHWCWVTAHLYEEQIFIGVFAVTQGCCQPVLHSSTDQWALHFATSSAAVHWWWVTAHLCEEQISIGVFAVTQGCCQPVLHSNTDQWALHFAKTSAAVHWCWVTAHLYECMILQLSLRNRLSACLPTSPELARTTLPLA